MAIKTTSDLAEWYGKTERTIHSWAKDGCPIYRNGGKGEPNQYNTVEVHNWLTEREIKKRVVTSDGQHYDKQEEDARLKHHQANLEELKEAEKRGELIPVDLAITEFGEKITNARAKILALASSVPEQNRDKLNAAIYKVLDELSQPETEIS